MFIDNPGILLVIRMEGGESPLEVLSRAATMVQENQKALANIGKKCINFITKLYVYKRSGLYFNLQQKK